MVTNTTETGLTELMETGEQRDALGRRRTPRERRVELLAAYRQSGLTQKAFARREGLKYTTFCCWAQAERRKGKLPVAPAGNRQRVKGRVVQSVSFAEVQLPVSAASASGLEVRLPDGMELRGSNAAELAALVRALRA
jgi:transposase-like protein